MAKKWLVEMGCVAVLALWSSDSARSTAGASVEYTRTCSPEFTGSSSRSVASAAATPAPKPHQPSPAESAVAQFLPTNDAKEIVRRSMEIDRRTLDLARNYTCQQREVIKHLDKQGNVKSTEVKTYDVGFYYGEEYSRLITVDDKPLGDKEKKKKTRSWKILAKLRNQSPEERQKRSDKERKNARRAALTVWTWPTPTTSALWAKKSWKA